MTPDGLVPAPGMKPGSPPRKDAPNPQQGMSDPAASISANTVPTATNTACTSPLTITSFEAAAVRGETAAAEAGGNGEGEGGGGGVPVVVSRVAPVVQPKPLMPVVDAMLSGPMANLALGDHHPAPPLAAAAPSPIQMEDKKLRFHRTPPTEHDNRKLFVGGLPTDVTDHAFLEYFRKFGDVIDSVVMVDRVTKRSRGFGFVTFASENDAATLLTAIPGKTGYVMINGKQCEVKASTPKIEDDSPKHGHHGAVGMWRSHHHHYRHGNRGYLHHRHHTHAHHQGHFKYSMQHLHQPRDDKQFFRDNQFPGNVDGRNFDQVYPQHQQSMNASYQPNMNTYGRSMTAPNPPSVYNQNYQNVYPGMATISGYVYPESSVPSWEAYPGLSPGYGQYAPNAMPGSNGNYDPYDTQYSYTYGNSSMPPSAMMGDTAHANYSDYNSGGEITAQSQGAGASESGFEPYPQSYQGNENCGQADDQYE